MKKVINQLITRMMMNSKTKLVVQKFAVIFKQIDKLLIAQYGQKTISKQHSAMKKGHQ